MIFAGYTGSKNPVQNRLKIQFVKLDFSNLIFQESESDQQDVYFPIFVTSSKNVDIVDKLTFSNRTIEWKSKRGQKNAEPHLLSLLCFLNSGYLSAAGKIQLQGASVNTSF